MFEPPSSQRFSDSQQGTRIDRPNKIKYFTSCDPHHDVYLNKYSICSDKLSAIYSDMLFGILSDLYSGILSDIHSDSLSGLLSRVYTDILSGILSDICSDILSGIPFDIVKISPSDS